MNHNPIYLILTDKSNYFKTAGKYVVYQLWFEDYSTYIGVTNNINRRLYEHKSNFKERIMSVKILFQTNCIDQAYSCEKVLVNDVFLNEISTRNKTRGGRHPYNMRSGQTHTAETKLKISESKKNNPKVVSEEARAAASLRMKNKNPMHHHPHRAKHKEIMSIKGAWNKGLPGTMLGKTLTVEQKAKNSYKIQTPIGIFPSSVAASKALDVSQQTVINRCKSERFTDWYIIEKGRYNV